MKTKTPAIRFTGFDDEWEEKRLGEVVVWDKGSELAKKELNDEGKGNPVIHYADLYKFTPVIDKTINWSETNQGTEIPENSLLFPMSDVTPNGLARTTTIIAKGIKAGGDTLIGTLEKSIRSDFASFQVNAFSYRILPLVTGTTVRHISASSLSTLNLSVPSLPEQEKIGTFFQKLDTLISLKQKKLTSLQNLKSSLLSKLFPTAHSKTPTLRFKGFEGEWEEKQLSQLSDAIGDGLHGTPKYSPNGDFAFINGNNLCNGSIIINPDTKFVIEDELSHFDKNFTNKTILISINGTIGNLAFYNNERIMLGKSVAFITLKKINPVFCFYFLQINKVKTYFFNSLTGSTIKNLGLKTIRETPVSFPSLPEQKQIGSLFQKLDHLITLETQSLTKLQNIKKAFLDKMFV